MSKFTNLNAESQAKVNRKLAELEEKTGRSWSLEVLAKTHNTHELFMLEAAVDGQILKPVVLDGDDQEPADRICEELDSLHQKLT